MSDNPVFSSLFLPKLTPMTWVLFMKGTAIFPQCGFSAAVVQVLNHLGGDFKGINVLEDQDIRRRSKIIQIGLPFHQLYVKGEFIGGCDIVREMFENGELAQILADKGIAHEK